MRQFRDTVYEVSESGAVINRLTGKVIKSRISKRGYHRVNLSINSKVLTFRLHRIVAEVYIPNSSGLPQVDHIDEDKNNNTVSNLRWCTNKENLEYYYSNNPDKCAKEVEKIYENVADMIAKRSKPVRINGDEYRSVSVAAKYISSMEPSKNEGTIRKELRNYVQGKRPAWCMYGKYYIG